MFSSETYGIEKTMPFGVWVKNPHKEGLDTMAMSNPIKTFNV